MSRMSITAQELELAGEEAEWSEVARWRFESLVRAGYLEKHARALARRTDVDLHGAVALRRDGCPPDLAFRILV